MSVFEETEERRASLGSWGGEQRTPGLCPAKKDEHSRNRGRRLIRTEIAAINPTWDETAVGGILLDRLSWNSCCNATRGSVSLMVGEE
jgi:hypothetical protein